VQRISTHAAGGPAEHADRAGLRQPNMVEPGDGLCCENPAGRASVDSNLMRLMILQKLAINARNILAGGGKGIFRPLTIGDGNDLDLADARYRN
jgi:hypothetical protein